MFNLRDFIVKGFFSAIGEMADYQIILNALGWFEKGVLTEEDLADIESAIEAQYEEEAIEEWCNVLFKQREGTWYCLTPKND